MEGGLALVHVPSVGGRLENAFGREAEFERRFVGILAAPFHSALLLQRFDVLTQIAVERINRTRHRSLAGIDKREPGLKLSPGEPMESSSKNPVAKLNGTKMFRSVFLNDARRCCFFTNIIVKYYYNNVRNLGVLWKSCSMAN